jgi:hypothetical protein
VVRIHAWEQKYFFIIDQMQKVKFVSRRGNAESEQNNIGFDLVEAELQGIDTYKLCNIYNKIIDRKPGRNEYVFIYALIDPRTLEVRYVGKSNDPDIRYNDHCSPRKRDFDGIKFRWIRELSELGLKPKLEVYHRVKLSESENYEYRYFKLFNYGNNLLNSATIQKETFQYQIAY